MRREAPVRGDYRRSALFRRGGKRAELVIYYIAINAVL